ncbi:MAG: hypothetical protein BRC29_03160 [Nanohaloarchaea archaeon SW_7_43_1]|nr:MAG: hypothetical protein BRC29_03160 [Nanohaloarchaea archaeon SW_7_43_1]
MKVTCLTDIHGYLDRALESFQELEEETGKTFLEDGKWVSDHKLVVNGDVFDRGPRNQDSLEWVLENADEYIIGNHEFFALFPDVTRDFVSEEYIENSTESSLYWREMPESDREKLIEAAASGDLSAAFKGHECIYIHAGLENPDVETLNSQLQEAGEKLLEGYRDGPEAYVEAQNELVWTVETENGTELRSKYPELFEAKRHPEGLKGGAIWNRFNQLDTDVKQVVGHTTSKYLREKGFDYNPQRNGEALNINTIRDSLETGSVALTVEDERGLKIYSVEIGEK